MAAFLRGGLAGRLAGVAGLVLMLALLASAPARAADTQATLKGARAVPPRSAPAEVKAMIHAANDIRHKPYRWGGGHRDWSSHGYDCSGSVSYVLHAAGLLDYPLVSSELAHWGKPRHNRWVTIFANEDHVYMIIAGLRWDTSYITDGDRTGPGWSEVMRSSKGFHSRHPAGAHQW
jgi:hypothetical protein